MVPLIQHGRPCKRAVFSTSFVYIVSCSESLLPSVGRGCNGEGFLQNRTCADPQLIHHGIPSSGTHPWETAGKVVTMASMMKVSECLVLEEARDNMKDATYEASLSNTVSLVSYRETVVDVVVVAFMLKVIVPEKTCLAYSSQKPNRASSRTDLCGSQSSLVSSDAGPSLVSVRMCRCTNACLCLHWVNDENSYCPEGEDDLKIMLIMFTLRPSVGNSFWHHDGDCGFWKQHFVEGIPPACTPLLLCNTAYSCRALKEDFYLASSFQVLYVRLRELDTCRSQPSLVSSGPGPSLVSMHMSRSKVGPCGKVVAVALAVSECLMSWLETRDNLNVGCHKGCWVELGINPEGNRLDVGILEKYRWLFSVASVCMVMKTLLCPGVSLKRDFRLASVSQVLSVRASSRTGNVKIPGFLAIIRCRTHLWETVGKVVALDSVLKVSGWVSCLRG
ncbi:hypothetical protein HJG60_009101 [Phyllostomus discolor]|uniref:Uncharacterized protein n=1 Tax=Phyllostomus discolor TaxID=89673 RepID=A0A833YJN1_9CHIR|nr:hypothetical protein HJG60_009101 [Phyllostomus discolor]